MQIGAITGYIDVAQVVLYVFWAFFAGLIYYLHRENKREGYPLMPAKSDRSKRMIEGFPPVPPRKTFLMADGAVITVPRLEVPAPLNAVPLASFPGAPLVPVGDPMLAAIGPGTFANRSEHPDVTFDGGLPKIVPLRAAPAFFLTWEDPDLRGFSVIGSDGVEAGTVSDVWIDRSEVVVRYLEVQLTLPGATHKVLLPMNYLTFRKKLKQVRTSFITGAQFATVPLLKNPDEISILEEDKVLAYYAGGVLFSTPTSGAPLL